MNDPWRDWKTDPPPLFTRHIREGRTGSLNLVVIDDNGCAHEDAMRTSDGYCAADGGGTVHNPAFWVYSPGAWRNVTIDQADMELSVIRRLQDAGALPEGSPERIMNNLVDGSAQRFRDDLDDMRQDASEPPTESTVLYNGDRP